MLRKTQKKKYMRIDAPKKKLYENRCSKKTRKQLYENRCSEKKQKKNI
jgi:hypothetical protein